MIKAVEDGGQPYGQHPLAARGAPVELPRQHHQLGRQSYLRSSFAPLMTVDRLEGGDDRQPRAAVFRRPPPSAMLVG